MYDAEIQAATSWARFNQVAQGKCGPQLSDSRIPVARDHQMAHDELATAHDPRRNGDRRDLEPWKPGRLVTLARLQAHGLVRQLASYSRPGTHCGYDLMRAVTRIKRTSYNMGLQPSATRVLLPRQQNLRYAPWKLPRIHSGAPRLCFFMGVLIAAVQKLDQVAHACALGRSRIPRVPTCCAQRTTAWLSLGSQLGPP